MRFLHFHLLIIVGLLASAQNYPARPNAYNADSLRNGEWITFYDSLGNEISRESPDIHHYCLMNIKEGRPQGRVECFYEDGIRSWVGRMVTIDPEIKQGQATSYHRNGAIWAKAYYENDTIQGFYQSFHPNGILETEGQMVDEKKSGEWTFFYDNGSPIGTVGHKDGMEHGNATIYNPDGGLNSKGDFKNGLQEGHWEVYHPNGVLGNKGIYRDGKREGVWVYFHPNGEINETGQYSEDLLHGYYRRHYENGQIETDGTYVKDIAEGYFTYYHDNGNKHSEGAFKNDLRQGPWKYYHENEAIGSEGVYKDDAEHGLWVYYFENGTFNRQVNWKNGKEHGEVTYYYANGQFNAKGIFHEGEKDGRWEYYHDDGTINGIENFDKGVFHGSAERYHPNGKLKQKGGYKNGNRDGFWMYKHPNGFTESEGYYLNDLANGHRIYYRDDGSKSSEGYYKDHLKDSIWTYYHPNGAISAQGLFKENRSTGLWKYYFENGELQKEGHEEADISIGEWTYYKRDGKLSSRGSFTDGKLHGPHYYYDSLGAVSNVVEYIAGVGQTFNNLFDSVDRLSLYGKFEKAEQTLFSAEKIYYRDFDKNDLKKTDLYELFGVYHRRAGQHKKALKYYQKALKHILRHKDDTSTWYTTTLDDLADTYTAKKDYESAHKTYQSLLEKIRQRPGGILTDEYASILRYNAVSLTNLDRQDEAIAVLKQDLQERKELPNQEKRIAALYFNILDAIYPTLGRELDSMIIESFEHHEAYDLREFYSYPSTHYYLARKLSDENQMDSAMHHFSECLTYNRIIHDTLNVEMATSLLRLGNFNYNRSNYSASGVYFRQAYNIIQNPTMQQPWLMRDITKAMANQFWAEDDYEQTIAFSERQIALGKDQNNHSVVGQGLNGMALAYAQLGSASERKIEDLHLEAIKELSKIDGYLSHFANANFHYAHFLRKSGRRPKAYQVFRNNLRYLSSFDEPDTTYIYRNYAGLSKNFYDSYQYDSAIFYSQKIIDGLKENPSKNIQQYLESYQAIGNCLSSQTRYEQAGSYFIQAMEEAKKYLGTEHELYLWAMIDVAENFVDQYNYTSAIQYYNPAIELGLRIRGKSFMLPTLLDLAEQYMNLEKYSEAIATASDVKKTYEELDMTGSYGYIDCLQSLGRMYEEKNDLREAENYFLQSFEVTRKVYATNSHDYARHVRRVGQFYLRNYDYALAYGYVAPAIDIIQQNYGDSILLYAWYAETMSQILLGLDSYAEAVNLQEKAAEIYLTQIGEEQDYMDAQYTLGEILAQMGQYEASVQALEKSRNAVLKKYGRYSFANTEDTREIAYTYLLWDKPEEALRELNIVKNLYDSLGVISSNYAGLYNLMGWCSLDLGKQGEARNYYQQAIHIADSAWGANSGSSNTYRNNLAFYHLQKGEFEQAEKLWLAVQNFYNDTDLENVQWMDNMAQLYMSWGKLEKAKPYWDQVNGLLINTIIGDFPLLSENGKAAFWDAYREDFEIFNTYAIQAHLNGDRDALGQMYDNQLQTKSLLLNTSTKERRRILNSGDKSLIDIYKRYVALKEDLVKYYGYSTQKLQDESIDLDALEKQADNFEKALSISGEGAGKPLKQSWKNVQRSLGHGEAAVEIIRLRHYDKQMTDSVLYAALILTPETRQAPILEVLPNGTFLEERAVKAYRSAIKFKVNDTRSYTSFWAPIDKHLGDVKEVYLSGDGVYHQVNIATFQRPDNTFIRDHYDLRLVSSTRTLTEVKRATREKKEQVAYIFGNPQFDLSHRLIESDLKERGLTEKRSFTRATSLDDLSFSELPGTKVETENVNQVLETKSWTTNLFLGKNALEDELKQINNPTLLHIATHGFFLDAPDETTPDTQLGVQAKASRRNALLRSGLLMAGATQTARGNQSDQIENGIFTAYEAMNLDLSSTELVILSACETGLGEIKNGEGVFGLQRAFQIAGARSILMSLWKVDDTATQLLMNSFYEKWLAGATELEALHHAQEVVKADYPDPYYWGAFVLVSG